jgi:hypothetical protein
MLKKFSINKVTVKIEVITPDMARRWMKKNVSNRPLTEGAVDTLVDIIKLGEWCLNGASVSFNIMGQLIDGQHRLAACIKSGIPIVSTVTRNLPMEAFNSIDWVRPRSLADVLACEHQEYYTEVASSLKIVKMLEHRAHSVKGSKIRPNEMRSILERHANLKKAPAAMNPYKKQLRGFLPKSVAVSLYYIFNELNHGKNKVFWDRILLGTDINSSMPEYILREKLIDNSKSKAKLNETHLVALIIKTWNAVSSGRTLKSLRWGGFGVEEFPIIHEAEEKMGLYLDEEESEVEEAA